MGSEQAVLCNYFYCEGDIRNMEREKVVSKDICCIAYNFGSKILEVEFKTGSVYQYVDVPAILYHGLKDAESKGSYFAKNIKKVFRAEKVS